MDSPDGLPQRVVRDIKATLGGTQSDWKISDYHYEWLEQGRVLGVLSNSGKAMVYFVHNGQYHILSRDDGIHHINRILTSYHFPREYFGQADKTLAFLDVLVTLRDGPLRTIPTQTLLRSYDRLGFGVSHWLQGREKDESEFRQMWYDPRIQFSNSQWTAVFNVFCPSGAVDEWTVTGAHSERTQTNEMLSITIRTLKEEGAYYYPMEGGH